MAHPDVLKAVLSEGRTLSLSPLTGDEMTVLAEALNEYLLRMPFGSARRVVADALRFRIGRLLKEASV